MAYTKQTWADLPSKTTPINAERLTHIEDGIFNAAQTADTAASTAGTAAANIGIVSGRVETLTGRVNGLDTAVSNKVDKVTGKGLSTNDYDGTDKGKVDSLGTASTKNSTSVVTESSDLVESGAVCRAIGIDFKNLLENTAVSSTRNGVTFTVNADKSVTINGIATDRTFFEIFEDYNHAESWNGYILTGCPMGGGENSYRLDISNVDVTTESDVGDGKEISIDTTGKIIIRIRIASGYTANNLVFYPMISKDGGTYEPHHASVEESLAEKADNSVIGTVEDGATASQAYAVNDVFIRNGALCKVTSAISQGDTLSNQFTVTNIGAILTALLNA